MATQNAWEVLFNISFSFPVVVFTFFLILSFIYWCVAALGMVDIDAFNADVDMDANPDAGSVSGVLTRFGLNGVPITLIITLIAFIGWIISYLCFYFFMGLVPTFLLKLVVGVVMLVSILYASTWITAMVIRPIRPALLRMGKQKVVNLIGLVGVVRTGTVNENFGEAKINDGGVEFIVKVRCYQGQTFSKGDRVVLIEKNNEANFYKVISESEYQS